MIGRRGFLKSVGAALGFVSLESCVQTRRREPLASLVPATPSLAPNYWCTWAVQNYTHGQGEREFDVSQLEGAPGAEFARNSLNERVLLGSQGWAKSFYPRVRNELFLLLDDGWEEGGTATFQLDREKFSSLKGTAQDRLRGLNESVSSHGWRGTALWCRNPPGGDADRDYVSWVKFAGIPYLKVDRGDDSGNLARERARQSASIVLEHIHLDGCLNGNWQEEGRFGPQPWGSPRQQILLNTDVYRTYDATAILGVATTLDRAAGLLQGASGHPEARALLNVEDEVYIAAVLGCSMGVMRHPLRGLRPGPDVDVFFPPPRNLKQRMDEVVRAIRWQRIAPPYSAGIGTVTLDTVSLTDEWAFKRGETFEAKVINKRVRQGAPSRLARNMVLPEVRSEGELPYVACTRFPGGAVAVGAFERVSIEKQVFQPRSHVYCEVGDTSGPVGIFGQYGSLTLVFGKGFRSGRILAQDLAGDVPVDVTDLVKKRGSTIVIPGSLIDQVGRSAGTPNDLSMPGLVLSI